MDTTLNPHQMHITTTVSEIAKSQTVRAADIFLIGPLMIYGGCMLAKYKMQSINRPLGLAMMAIGIGTIFYNGRNYLANQRTLTQL